jgi:hypothetical protein
MKTTLTRYDDPERFYTRIAHALTRHEAENNLLLGILENVRSGDYPDIAPYMAAVEQDGDLVQALLRTPPHPLLLSYREDAPSEEVVHRVIDDLRHAYSDELSGMTGDRHTVNAYVNAWQKVTGKKGRRREALRIYRLTEVRAASGAPGTMRRFVESDIERITEWMIGFQQDALHERLEPDRARATAERYLAADHVRRGMMVWEVDGTPVSMAG